jgi:hypothetical protein
MGDGASQLKRFRAKHARELDPWVDTGSREENASKQEAGASVLIRSEPIMLHDRQWWPPRGDLSGRVRYARWTNAGPYGGSGTCLPPSAELGRHRILRLPSVELIRAGPCMDLAHANPAFKPAGMLMLILLLGRGVIHPAIRAGKIFNRPDAVSHRAIMRRIGLVFQPKRLPPSTTSYSDPRNHGLFGSVFLTSLRRDRRSVVQVLDVFGEPRPSRDLRPAKKPEAGPACNRIGIPTRAP